jgi:membrane protease YdiL (CAAX protease family)
MAWLTKEGTDLRNKILTFQILLFYFPLTLLLKHQIHALGMPLYWGLLLVLTTLAIGLMLHVDRWKVELKSNMRFLPSLLFTFGGFIIIMLTTNAWVSWLRSISPEYANPSALGVVSEETAVTSISILMSVIIAPLREELIFRFGFLRTFSFMMRPWLALILSAAVFAASHFISSPTVMLVPYFIGGLVLGLTYFAIGLPWSILLHFLLNVQPLLNAKGALNFLDGNAVFLLYLALAVAGMWVFVSSLIRSRKLIFGRPKTFP